MNIGQTPRNTSQWFGTIDDIRIYNRVLSEEEIKELYEEG
ncbi:MAG: LamG-like jellyroll fold domain-containing protein [Thermodesulfobacteriota bacterium]